MAQAMTINIKKTDVIRVAQLTLVLLLSLCLKFYYSTASANELQWILAPTAWLVSLATGMSFQFEPYGGYLSLDRTFLIAPACSGVNFLIVSFLVLTLGKLWRGTPRAFRWSFLPAAISIAYLSTIIANTTRISGAILLRPFTSGLTWIDPEEVHRLEGIIIYFSFLILVFVASELMEKTGTTDKIKSSDVVRRLPMLLLVYYAVTLGIPIINGAFRDEAFWNHTLFVLFTPIILVFPLVALLTDRAEDRAEDREA
ncbi:MAG: exosortase K [Acidobacteriota bacterium]